MTNWQRLEQVIKWTGMSTHAFAMAIGLKRSENLYQIKRGNFGISKELARLITLKYPNINRSWLLTDEGQMITDSSPEAAIAALSGAIPYYQSDILSLYDADVKPLYHIVLPMFKSATFAAVCSGNAMSSTAPSGSTVVVRETVVAAILPGEVYMVVTNDYSVLRRVRTFEADHQKLLLVADNKEKYDDIIVSKDCVTKIFLVLGVIINSQM